ncbi:MAG TPA: dihydropteroate synthase [Ignavibacteriaceae bacterium]|nr:dihydropteroate synthase [Ignavibacteriaceae bacterium]
MIVQVNYRPEEFFTSIDLKKSSQLNFTFSGMEKDQLEILSNICNQLIINLEIHNSTFPVRNNLSLPINDLNKYLSEFDSAGLNDLSNEIKKSISSFEKYKQQPVLIGNREFHQTVIMGILNVTPDSFSDAGKYYDKNSAVDYAIKMFDFGADIIDVGGESTRPGSEPVSEEEELRRVIPVIDEILKKNPEALVSIDTTKSKVALKACDSGAKIINDISGLTFNQELADIAKEFSAALVVMHIKGIPKNMQLKPVYDDLIFEIYEYLYHQTEIAKSKGVKNIFVDPGIGFGKRIEDNFEIIRRVSDFKSLGYPILIGLSRKSFLGKTLDLDINDRDNATMVSEAIAIRNGAKIIRTHNVENAVRTKKLLNYIFPN